MLKKRITLFIFAITFGLQAQEDTTATKTARFTIDSTSALTLDSTIKTYYDVISAKKDTVRNWKQFKFFLKKTPN